MAKKQKGFRLEEEYIRELGELATRWGTSQTDALERAIHSSYTESYTSYTESYTPDEPGPMVQKAFEALTDQLAVKDKLIETLSKALLNAQAQGQAAQALHASDKPALTNRSEEPEAKEPETKLKELTFRQVWSRWRKARKGESSK